MHLCEPLGGALGGGVGASGVSGLWAPSSSELSAGSGRTGEAAAASAMPSTISSTEAPSDAAGCAARRGRSPRRRSAAARAPKASLREPRDVVDPGDPSIALGEASSMGDAPQRSALPEDAPEPSSSVQHAPCPEADACNADTVGRIGGGVLVPSGVLPPSAIAVLLLATSPVAPRRCSKRAARAAAADARCSASCRRARVLSESTPVALTTVFFGLCAATDRFCFATALATMDRPQRGAARTP